ncbi:MAG: hypothetical protein KGK34_01070 [Chloroflexota bacterium]|nr:hypothetical protein [Chloroflexota bacterium]
MRKARELPNDIPIAPNEPTRLATQTVGNIGLYFVCYRLSQHGWNVMPTARNARGIDIVAYSQDGKRTRTIQVTALSKRNAAVLGGSLDGPIAEFVVVCRNVRTANPESFVLTADETLARAKRGGQPEKPTFWLETKAYEGDGYCERWDKIGEGS